MTRVIPTTFILLIYINSAVPFCWKPNTNPFTGVPDVQRVDSSSVRVLWYDIFPNGTGCEEVDFLIKSHPLNSPSDYKLSDFTVRNQRSATLVVPQGKDFIFQVIARENKGSAVGIEYAYSRPATSLVNPNVEQKKELKKSIWVAGSNPRSGQNKRLTHPPRRTVPTLPSLAPRLRSSTTPRPHPATPIWMRPSTTTVSPRFVVAGPVTARTYIRPKLKSLDSNYDYNDSDENMEPNPWYIYECVPLLKNLGGFDEGTNTNSILKEFIHHMNGNAVNSVKTFIEDNKNCKKDYEGRQPGHLVETGGTSQCCNTPWGDNSQHAVCYKQFARCDGHCIPDDWVADGWPDCMDGADEADMAVDGKVLPFQLGCLQCAGVVLSAGFLCRETGGLSRSCVESLLGPGQCNVCIGEYMNL